MYVSLTWITCILVEEADVEDDQGNINKELYVLQVAPLESHASYRLETEDPAVFSDGGDDDPDSWVCPRVWPHIPIHVQRRRPAPPTGRSASNVLAESSCGSAHIQLKKDLLLKHHSLVKLLAALDIDAWKEYRMHSAPAVLSHIQQGNKTCAICQHICSSTQALKVSGVSIWRIHHSIVMNVTILQETSMGWIYITAVICLQSPDFNVISAPKVSQKWHLKQHQKEHWGRFGPCPHCMATFAQKSGLVSHVPRCPSQEGGAPEKQHSCEICGRKYSRKSELTRHLQIKH